MWCDQAKSVWSRLNSVFSFLTNCMHHFLSYILQKTPLKLINWFQRYEQLKDAKNNRKQKKFSALFGSILKSIFPTSDWFCLITSHISILKQIVWETQKWHYNFSWLKGSWVIDQNSILYGLINNTGTLWSSAILIPFLGFSDNLLQDTRGQGRSQPLTPGWAR